MLCNRIKQFREYNQLDISVLANILGVSEETYSDYESGQQTPDIDIITKLTACYKVTLDEFYGYTPRLALHTDTPSDTMDDVPQKLLKLSDLSWDEAQLIMYYRTAKPDDELIKQIIQKNDENNK